MNVESAYQMISLTEMYVINAPRFNKFEIISYWKETKWTSSQRQFDSINRYRILQFYY